MPWGIVIPADEDAVIEFRLFGPFTDYQEAVGGPFEAVDIDRPSASFFVNEEGKLIGLPLNRRATLIWWTHDRRMRNVDVLLGDVVLIGQPDEEGQTMDVPGELVTLLMKSTSWKLEVETLDAPGVWNGNQAVYDSWPDAYNAALSLSERWFAVTDIRVIAA